MGRSDPTGADPAFRRIAETLRGQIVRGEVEAGQRLPAIRQKAKELGVSSDTVYKAYELLKSEGMLVSRMGSAVMVSGSMPGRHQTEFLTKSIERGSTAHYESVSASSPVRSLATNVGDPSLFPADEFLTELGELRRSSPWDFYFSPPEGDAELRQQLADWLTSLGTRATPDRLLITLGSQQAMSLISRYLLTPGSTIVMEGGDRLDGAQHWRLGRHKRVVVPRLKGDRADVRSICPERPDAIYVAPTGCPATGRVMPLSDRREFLDGVAESRALLIEDASYAWLTYAERPPDLAALSPRVVQIGSFSYCLAPGLRIGYILASRAQIEVLSAAQQAETGTLPLPLQRALARFLRGGRLAATLRRNIPKYLSRRNALLAAVRHSMPREVVHSTAAAGFACRLTLPAPIDMRALYAESVRRGVAFTPGDLLFAPSEASTSLRVCFGVQTEAVLTEAIKTLGGLVTVSLAFAL